MKITLENEYLIYIYLADRSNFESVTTISDVNGFLLHDDEGNWVGYRLERTQDINRQPIELPPLVKSEFSSLEKEQVIDLFFVEGVKPANWYEQDCNLDVCNGEIVGIEIIKYEWNPIGKDKWIVPFMKKDHKLLD